MLDGPIDVVRSLRTANSCASPLCPAHRCGSVAMIWLISRSGLKLGPVRSTARAAGAAATPSVGAAVLAASARTTTVLSRRPDADAMLGRPAHCCAEHRGEGEQRLVALRAARDMSSTLCRWI
jgi:hypothetical protein